MTRGKYIVIEGSDGTGKSTQVTMLRDKLREQGIDSIEFHEPGGLPITNSIREIILNSALKRQSQTNLLLFTAARHELWHNARRQLENGTWVVASRSYFSSLVYQGYGEGIDRNLIIETTHQFTDDLYMQPDQAVILTLEDEKEREKRISKRGKLTDPDTFESKDTEFQRAIQDGYLRLASDHHLPAISTSAQPEEVAQQIYAFVARLL